MSLDVYVRWWKNKWNNRRKRKKEKTYGDKLSIPSAISPAIFFISLFFFLSPSFFLRLFSFHSLIYRVDNWCLSDIQWQVRNVAEERERKERRERQTERKLFTMKRVDQPVFTFDYQGRRERRRSGWRKKSEKWFFQYRWMIACTGSIAWNLSRPRCVRSLDK